MTRTMMKRATGTLMRKKVNDLCLPRTEQIDSVVGG